LKNTFKILAVGDVVGPRACDYLAKNLWRIRKEYSIDMVIVNGENSAEPNGIEKSSAGIIFDSGADVITTGNHLFRKSSVFSYLDDKEEILRPLNYPSECPGHGDVVVKIDGYKILVLNVMGQAYLDASSCPFEAVEKSLKKHEGEYDFCVLDIHAEATGEKKAIAYNFQDKISGILAKPLLCSELLFSTKEGFLSPNVLQCLKNTSTGFDILLGRWGIPHYHLAR
jgi:calcineurin-like phosphoesterase